AVLGNVPAQRRDGDRPALELLHLNSGERIRIDHGRQATLSPDGRRAALLTQPPKGNQRLIVVDLQTLEIREVGQAGQFDSRPLWHPEGDRLALVQRDGESSGAVGLAVYAAGDDVGLLHELDQRWVLLYSRFDVYRASPDGERVERLTQGREHRIRFREHRLDWHAGPPDETSALYFSAFNEQDKSHGYLRHEPDEGARWLINQPRRLQFLQKADAADAFVVMAESATESPNFHFTDDDFRTLRRVTNTNPQQSAYHWAGDELSANRSTQCQYFRNRSGSVDLIVLGNPGAIPGEFAGFPRPSRHHAVADGFRHR
ncbi:TolB family protein, partial [Ectothiorhodospira sp. 9100]|uniref:TolB family protein n=1 Tax=Ectothiorhodospira sp. 9100 TaxID=2897388 RepID=UPI001EE7BE3B